MTAHRWRDGFDDAVPFFRGLRRRIGATIALLVGGFCWVILYLAFLAGRFAWYQSLAVVLVSFLVVPAIVVFMWISWGAAFARRMGNTLWDDDFF
jgi:hypothetical protein